MALIDKARGLLSALTLATLVSCGPGTREPGPLAEPSTPFKPATAPDLSPPKGGEPVGALPSQVVSGEVAPFRSTFPSAGLQKKRAAAGRLPSSASAGKSAVYAPRQPAGPGAMQDAAGQDGDARRPPPASR